MPIFGGDLYEKIDAVQRKDFAYSWGLIKAIADEARRRRGTGTVRALVVLGNGAVIRTGVLDFFDVRQGPISGLDSR
jgi:hypothetical protein